jgi:hypothetical protein
VKVRRSVLILIGAAMIAAGVTVALVPFQTDFSLANGPGVAVYGRSDCGTPIRAAFRAPSEPGAWFAYAPGTEAIASDGYGCQTPARRRVGLGALLVITGGGALALAHRLQRRKVDATTVA